MIYYRSILVELKRENPTLPPNTFYVEIKVKRGCEFKIEICNKLCWNRPTHHDCLLAEAKGHLNHVIVEF